MVDGLNPVMLLLKVPDPVPSEVLVLRLVVGPGVVDQQTPLSVTVNPPSFEIFPPAVAVVWVRLLT